jgi:hypothetical protein
MLMGLGIAYVDTRPGWDDTAVVVVALLLCAGLLAALTPGRWWLLGLAVGLPVLLLNAALHGNHGAAAAVPFALVGSGVGRLAGRAIRSDQP